jgi:hypothetical protein
VEILELEDERGVPRSAFEDVSESLEDAELRELPGLAGQCVPGGMVAGGRQLRNHAGENRTIGANDLVDFVRVHGAKEVAQSLGDRAVRRGMLAEVEREADDHPSAALACAIVPLGQQARLADPGVAADQDGCGTARGRRLERVIERGQLVEAADERSGRERAHAPMIRTARFGTTTEVHRRHASAPRAHFPDDRALRHARVRRPARLGRPGR